MVRVKHCCCGCTLDIGARIIIWTDLIATFVVGLSVMAKAMRGEYTNDYLWFLSSIIIPVKLLILIGAVMGVKKKKASYLQPYIVYNVLAIITIALLVIVGISQFDHIVDSDLMKNMMGNWEAVKKEYRSEYRRTHEYELNSVSVYGQPTADKGIDLLDHPEVERAARVAYLILAIVGGIVNFFAWTYFNIILQSYYKTLLEGGNFTNVDGVEYFAPTEQTGGKSVPPGATPQGNIPHSYFAAAPYPTQPVMLYPQAPPPYDEAAGPNAFANPSFPPTSQ